MAGTSLLALIDDIASVLDDVALMTKIAAKKTAGMLGDDLALNAEQVAGVRADRELPVVWAVAKGSFRNKLILVPAALLISSVAPWIITPLLMVGGTYLCFEGFEKLVHAVEHRRNGGGAAKHASDREHAFVAGSEDLRAYEHKKVRGAIRTDFILSAEIVVIALGTVRDNSFPTQVLVISGIAILMTVGVYGVVAAIVKLDDLGLYLVRTAGPRVAPGGRELETSAVAAGSAAGRFRSRMKRFCGQRLVAAAPLLMKLLAIVGTLAMFTVGGGILLHGLPGAESAVHRLEAAVARAPTVGPFVSPAVPTLLGALVGVVAGALALGVVKLAAWGWGFVSGADRDSDSDSDSDSSQTTRPKT